MCQREKTIHEQVFSSLEVRRQQWGLDNRLGDAALRHRGYQAQVVKDRNKVQRNLSLLERALQEMPGEPSLLMNYGLELTRSGQAEAGLQAYRQAFELMSAQPAALLVPEGTNMANSISSNPINAVRLALKVTAIWDSLKAIKGILVNTGTVISAMKPLMSAADIEVKSPSSATETPIDAKDEL